jgi:hypothetical protein
MTTRYDKRRLKEDIAQVLSEELGSQGPFNCGRKAFNLDKHGETKNYLAEKLFEVLEKYMVTPHGKFELYIGLVRQGGEPVDNFVRLGEIYEVAEIEKRHQGEIVLKLRDDLKNGGKR